MRRELARRGNLVACRDDLDFSESRQLFCRNRSAPQDVDLAAANRDDRRFNSVRSRPAVDDQRNAAAELIENMLGRRGTDSSEPVCAWGSERFFKRLDNFR